MSNNHSQPTKWSDFDLFLRPEHLKGQRVSLRISEVSVEEFYRPGSGKVKMPLLHFENTRKRLPINVTNQRALIKALGDEVDACIGKTVTLEAVVINNKDSIKITVPPQPKPQPSAVQKPLPPARAAEPNSTREQALQGWKEAAALANKMGLVEIIEDTRVRSNDDIEVLKIKTDKLLHAIADAEAEKQSSVPYINSPQRLLEAVNAASSNHYSHMNHLFNAAKQLHPEMGAWPVPSAKSSWDILYRELVARVESKKDAETP